jgi:RNA polymerase sigma-70 factor, ECF subfamily
MRNRSTVGDIRTVTAAARYSGALSCSAALDDRAPGREAWANGSGGPDVELMGRVARGDADAQRQVVCKLLRRVEGLCRVVLRNGEAALDACQLSMLQILKSAHDFPCASTLERWADRITVRTALRAATSERAAQRPPADLELATTDPKGESVLLARHCLDRISVQQRVFVIMRHALGYSIAEIAEMTGVSENAVKAGLLQAHGTMRRVCRREQRLFDVSRCNP